MDGNRHVVVLSSIRFAMLLVYRYLRQLLPGRWQKVIKLGNCELHYFEHESGQVAGVKFFANKPS